MRSRIVVWGTNSKDEKVLLAIALNADDNKIDIWSIPEREITEEFYNLMMSEWREGKDLEIPSTAEHRVNELTMADGILPDDIRVERSDIIQRAQMEWHFVVLSSKLYRNFKTELEDFSDRVKRMELFDQGVWDELKGLWEGVQKHIYDKNLFRDHSDSLKSKANSIFEELKLLRKALNAELNQKSKIVSDNIQSRLVSIEEKIASGAVLKPLFDDLKKIQEEFKTISINREDREILWKKLNEAFKAIREKREGGSSNSNNSGSFDSENNDRISRRFDGLVNAIQKMEQSIARDVKDIEFENKRIESSQGQLEAQIRVAKIRMIEDRIRSKQEKLDELLKTRVKLEKITDKIKKREEKQVERAKDITRLKEEEEKIKAKIADEIHTAQDSISTEEAEKLLKAAEGIKASKAKKAETIVDEVQASETEQQPTEVVAAAEETVPMKEKLVTEIIPASEFPTSVELSETISENLPDSIDTDVVANQESDNSNK
jgi:hypothetical protein